VFVPDAFEKCFLLIQNAWVRLRYFYGARHQADFRNLVVTDD